MKGFKGIRRILGGLKILTAVTALTRALPVLRKPEGSHYLTSFLQDPGKSGTGTRLLVGLFHCYVYGFNTGAGFLSFATMLVCCTTIVAMVRRIK